MTFRTFVLSSTLGMASAPMLGGCVGPLPVIDYGAAADRMPVDVAVRIEGRSSEPIDEAGQEPVALSLADAVRRAVLHDPRIQAAIARVRQAEADGQQARLLPNPILSVSVRLFEGGGDPIYGAALAADFVSLLSRPRKASVADAKLRSAAAAVLTTVSDVVAETEEAYYAVQSLVEESAVLEDRRKLADRLVQIGRARLAAGEAARLDVIALESQQVQLVVDLADKRQELAEARLTLAHLIGRPSSSAVWELLRWTAPRAAAATERAWVERALHDRSELLSKRWELAALGDELSLADWAAWEGSDIGVSSEWDQRWSVGPAVTVPLPIFDWGQAKRAKASAAIDEARHQTTLIRRQIVHEVRTQYSSYAATLATLALARDQLLPMQEKRAAQAEASYKAGETDVANLLLAEEDLLDTRVKVVGLQKRAVIARVKLRRAVGGGGIAEKIERAATQPATAPIVIPEARP